MSEVFPPIFSPKRYFLDAPKEQQGTCFVLNEDFEVMRRMYALRKEEAESLIVENNKLAKALLKYSIHVGDCPHNLLQPDFDFDKSCTCGLAEMLTVCGYLKGGENG